MAILLVDDNEMSRGVLVKMLELSGYQTIEAGSGEEGLMVARKQKPDLIISDIMMPDGDGYQFCRALRLDPEFKDTPFIFYSAAFTSPEDIGFAYDLGATRFLQKPQNPRKVLEVVKELLAKRTGPTTIESSSSQTAAQPPSLEEPDFLRQHSERVIQKLEEKVKELESTKNFLETVLNSMTESLIVIGQDGRILDANYAACTLFNRSKEEITGKKCFELLHGVGRFCSAAMAVCPFPSVFQQGQPTRTKYEHTITCPGHILEVSASPVRNENGEITCFVELIRDVTETAKLEEEVSNRIRQLEDFYDASVQKELRLIELEKEVERLRKDTNNQ